MKKILIVGVLLCLVAFSVGASDILRSIVMTGIDLAALRSAKTVTVNGEQVKMGGISINKLKKNFAENDFSTLTLDERVAIYEETHLKISSPLWRNLLIGFGAGSKSQGDLAGEITGQILDWSSLSLVGVGAGLFLIEFIMLGMFGQSVDFQNPDELTNLSLYMMGGGAALFVLGRIIQAILPAIYGSRFNKTLREGLNLTKDMSDKVALGVSLDPAISLDKEPQLGVRLVANLAIAP